MACQLPIHVEVTTAAPIFMLKPTQAISYRSTVNRIKLKGKKKLWGKINTSKPFKIWNWFRLKNKIFFSLKMKLLVYKKIKSKHLLEEILPEQEHETLHKTAEVVMAVNGWVWLEGNVTKHLGIHGQRVTTTVQTTNAHFAPHVTLIQNISV